MSLRYSIIIPHKNRLSLLKRLVDSIPKREDLEIIIIDDLSEKNVQDEVKKFADNTIAKLFHNSENYSKGAGWARNIGIDNAQGEYILFADSDDYYSNHAFQYFDEETENSTSDLIVFKSDSVDSEGNISNRTDYSNFLIDTILGLRSQSRENIDATTRKILMRFDPPWSKLFKRSFLLDKNIRFEEIRFSNDVIFNALTVINAHTISLSKNRVYIAMKHNNSLVHTYTEESLDQRFQACLRFNELVSKHGYMMSVSGGYIGSAKRFGLAKMAEMWRQSRKANVSLFYPPHRYFISILKRMVGHSAHQIRLYIIFGKLKS